MPVRLAIAPIIEPVSLADMKEHLHYDATDQNDRIEALISAARSMVESETNRALLTQGWTMILDAFPAGGLIRLPNPPVQSITSIAYTDNNGDAQTVDSDNYQLDAISQPGRLAPARGLSWPSDADSETLGAVVISYQAGWTTAATVPNELVHAIKLLTGHWFENLEGVVTEGTPKELPFAVRMLLTHWTIPTV